MIDSKKQVTSHATQSSSKSGGKKSQHSRDKQAGSHAGPDGITLLSTGVVGGDTLSNYVSLQSSTPCMMCRLSHSLMQCPNFKSLKVCDRICFVQKHQLCSNWLRDNHVTSDCTSNNQCFVCQEKHSAFLHIDNSSTSHAMSSGVFFMPIVKVLVNDKVWAWVALDTFSSSSFCTESLSKSLGLKGPVSHYTLKAMGGICPTKSKQVTIEIASGNDSILVSGVKVVESNAVTSTSLDQGMFPHMQGLDLSANVECQDGDILIGQDFADALQP